MRVKSSEIRIGDVVEIDGIRHLVESVKAGINKDISLELSAIGEIEFNRDEYISLIKRGEHE